MGYFIKTLTIMKYSLGIFLSSHNAGMIKILWDIILVNYGSHIFFINSFVIKYQKTLIAIIIFPICFVLKTER